VIGWADIAGLLAGVYQSVTWGNGKETRDSRPIGA
jgi:hypothetical protein